jgi:hypothetical protein
VLRAWDCPQLLCDRVLGEDRWFCKPIDIATRTAILLNRPLSFSLKIGERWYRCGGTDAWPEWEVFPTTPWNYGLVLDAGEPLAGFKVVEKVAARRSSKFRQHIPLAFNEK